MHINSPKNKGTTLFITVNLSEITLIIQYPSENRKVYGEFFKREITNSLPVLVDADKDFWNKFTNCILIMYKM